VLQISKFTSNTDQRVEILKYHSPSKLANDILLLVQGRRTLMSYE